MDPLFIGTDDLQEKPFQWTMRRVSGFLSKWKWAFVSCLAFYCLVIYWPAHDLITESDSKLIPKKFRLPKVRINQPESLKEPEALQQESSGFKFESAEGKSFFVEKILTDSTISLAERLQCRADKNARPRVILSWNAGHDQSNLGGCPDWNCELTLDRSKFKEAGAILVAYEDPYVAEHRRPDQYVIHFSQESPVNSHFKIPYVNFFNMSLGFRHDTPAASPYGYFVKLAQESRNKDKVIDMAVVEGKSKGAAWFVSHCGTNSRRENFVKALQQDFPVDIYGACGTLKCPRGGACENMLDKEYHFYVAFENSICKDYITEKLWNQGYLRDIVPLVLKRSVVESFVPPKSFIAADDFNSSKDLAAYLHYLMGNKTAYAEYFAWRRDYKVVFLNGKYHDSMERPWGFCQVCRLLWEKPRPHFVIEDFGQWWVQSCEKDGSLVSRLTSSIDDSPNIPLRNAAVQKLF
ncbi:hypothetical protein Q1695_011596 [Nippostrongylus brasiliensis]|nr:hypothetical protein Q1695_011596 [Nippostrongylus brasiliensis]